MDQTPGEAYNPWSVVNLVFHHLAAHGLHPVFGELGDPAEPAADLLRRMGIRPAVESDGRAGEGIRQQLAQLRETMLGER